MAVRPQLGASGAVGLLRQVDPAPRDAAQHLARVELFDARAQLALHVRAAIRNGLTREEIREVLLQVAIYAGVPAANRAFGVAQKVLAEIPED